MAWESFWDDPLLGSGPGTFHRRYEESEISAHFARGSNRARDAHNTYVEVLVGMGLAGLIPFLIIVFRALKYFYQARTNFKNQGDQGMTSLVDAYLFSFISILLYFFMLSRFTYKYFWICLGLSQVALYLSSRNAPETREDHVAAVG